MPGKQELYDSVVSDLYQGTLDTAAWDRGLTGVAALVGGEGPLLMSSRHDRPALSRYCLYSYEPSMFAQYANYWLPHDPRVPRAARVAELDMFTERTLLQDGSWERTEIFNEYLRPNDAAWVLGSTLHSNADKFTLLCIQGTRSRGPFSPDDADCVRPLMVHLRRALEIKDRLEYQGYRADALRGVVNGLSFGVVVLEERRRVVEASSLACRVLQSVCRVAPRAGESLQLFEPAQRELSSLLASSLTRGQLRDGLIHVPRGHGVLPVSILVAPAPVTLQAWILSAPRWLLFVFDPEQRVTPIVSMLERDLCLSTRESEVVALLAMGVEPPLVARRLGITLNTLRTHLKASLRKTGYHSRSDLMRRVLGSVAHLQRTS